MKKIEKYFKGFTLVELIIVITILAILATIAFISFQNYTKDARDANRKATIKNIEKGLELFTLKTGNFPSPDESTTFTGGLDGKVKINQGIVGDNVARVINMNTIPLDPKDEGKYTYSTFGDDNKYYQVTINAENSQTSFTPQAFAFSPKSAIVKGNYRFDPSLPSLIVVPGSINTASGIFDPSVCFIIDGGQNSLNDCIKEKEEMSLKDFDSSLVGYWDMETTFLSGEINYLKDLSGNGNDGSFSGIILPTLTVGILGKAYNFIDTNKSFIDIPSSNSLEMDTGNFTIQAIIKANKNQSKGILTKQSTGKGLDSGSNCSTYHNYCGYQLRTGSGLIGGRVYDKGDPHMYGSIDRVRVGYYDYIGKNLILTYTLKNGELGKIYINGILLQTYTTNRIVSNISISKNPLRIGRYWNDYDGGIYEFFDGTIDDIKIYNRALSDKEISQQSKIAGF